MKREELFVVVETIDYNNGETLAESNIVCIGSEKDCKAKVAELQKTWKKVADLNDVSDNYFWFEDTITDIKHSFAVKRPI